MSKEVIESSIKGVQSSSETPFISLPSLSNKVVDTSKTEQDLDMLAKESFLDRWRREKFGDTKREVHETVIKERTQKEDKLNLAEDFIENNQHFFSTGCEGIGNEHTWKRMNVFFALCNFVREKASFWKNDEFPERETNQFAARVYSVPPGFEKRFDSEKTKGRNSKYKGCERAHVAILNKLILKPKDEVRSRTTQRMQIYGNIKYLNQKSELKEADLQDFLNVCDIVPKAVNAIDGVMEQSLRLVATQHLNQVKETAGKKMAHSPTKAAHQLAIRYLTELEKLESDITSNTNHYSGIYFDDNMAAIKMDRKSIHYIKGMKAAIVDFCYLTGSKDLQKQTPTKIKSRVLYVKPE